MLSLLRQRNYALVWSSSLVSRTGTAMLATALPYYVYATSHSVAASGTAVISETLPGVVFHTVGGVFADRIRRKAAMAAGNAIRGLIILSLLAVHDPSTLWIVYLVGFLNQTVAALAGPFGNAALPHIVRADQLTTANAAFSAANSAADLVGAPLGGLLLQQIGLSAVVLLDALSFLTPTVAILLIDVPLEDRGREVSPPPRVRQLIRELSLGWQYVWHTPLVARVFLVTIVNYLGAAVFMVAFAPFVRQVLGGSAEFYSWAIALQALSGIAGALVMSAASKRAGPRALVSGSLLFIGLSALIEVLAVRQAVTLAVSVVVGIPAEFNGASLNALLQMSAEDAYRGRVWGTYFTTNNLTLLLGTTLTTATADRLGIRTALFGGSLMLLLAAFTAMKVLPHSLPSRQQATGGGGHLPS